MKMFSCFKGGVFAYRGVTLCQYYYSKCQNKQNCQMTAVDDAVYDTLIQLTKREFDVPVKQRSAQQKASCVRFWRNKSKFSIQSVNGEEKLFFDGKAVMKKAEL